MMSVAAERPQEDMTAYTVQYYSKHAKELTKSTVEKANRLVQYGCVRYVGDDNEYAMKCSFVCLPLNTQKTFMDEDTAREFFKKPYHLDYNNTSYTITKHHSGGFECNCQGWQTKARKEGFFNDGCMCSHVLALFFCFKLRWFNRGDVNVSR